MRYERRMTAATMTRPIRLTALLGVLCVATSMAVLSGCLNQVPGSGNTATEQREVPAFNEVQVSGSTEVRIAIGNPQSVSVTADDNILPVISTTVQGQRLIIRPTRPYRARTQEPLVAITVPDLRAVQTSGLTTMTINGLSTSEFHIQTSGSSRITVDRLSVESLRIDTSGSSDIQANGRAERVAIATSGSSTLRLNDLAARAVEVDSSGSARIEVQASESLTGRTSGSANVIYSGSPGVSISSSGSSRVTRR